MPLPARRFTTAEVAELADALASGASGSNPIGVQIPASAPTFVPSTHPVGCSNGLNYWIDRVFTDAP